MATGIRDPSESTYTFTSQPRAVVPQRRKYRDAYDPNASVMQPCNIMYDPRVIRGNTYRQQQLLNGDIEDQQDNPVDAQRQQEARRKRQARARAQERLKAKDIEPVPGRQHIEVQTELYLEELTDRVEETDIGVQTDPFLDRAPDPLFIPAKTGVDVETQIEDGDLFDFDRESKPILEVLVGKTIEQALMEVMEEEELDRLRDHQLQFEEFRNAELMETQRLEEQARRRREEKSRRLRQQAEVARQEREAAKKIAARSFAQSYLSGLVPSVFQNLESGGYFYDQQEREIEADFMPWLMDGVETRLAHYGRARALLDSIIADCVGVTLGDGNNEAAAAVESGAEGCADDGGEADAAEGDDVAGASGAGTADAGGGPVDETPVRKMTSFEALDKNSDGHISQDEYDAVDTDGDGVLSAAELDAAKARRLAEMSAEDGSAGEPQEGDGVAEEPKEGDQESGTAPEPQEGEADAEAPKEDNDSTSSPQEGEVGTDELKEEDDANAIAPAPQMGEGTEEPKAGDNTTTSTPRPQEGEDAAAATNDADAAGA